MSPSTMASLILTTAVDHFRPHVMYMVPIGQNPSGATMGAQRKKDIYEVCVKYGKCDDAIRS